MEYSELIQKILATEQSAQEIMEDAQDLQEKMEADFRREGEQLQAAYLERVRRRLDKAEQEESEKARAAMARLDEEQARAIAAVERMQAEQEDAWVDTLFHMAIGDAP